MVAYRQHVETTLETPLETSYKAVESVKIAIEVEPERWTKCPQCQAIIYCKRLWKNNKVCPECAYHFHLSARERLEFLLDTKTFVEYHGDLTPLDPLCFVDSKPYTARLAESQRKSGEIEAALCGTGKIGGFEVAVCVLDFAFLGGSMGSVVGEKVARTFEMGLAKRLPVVICSASGGARMQEGTLSLMQMAKTTAAFAVFSEAGIPYFSLLSDPTYGGVSASFASVGDIIIAEPRARIGFAGRQVIEKTIGQKLSDNFQTAEFLLEKGQVDLIVPRSEQPAMLAQLLSYYFSRPVKPAPSSPVCAEPLSRPQPQRTVWETVQIARHAQRPNFGEYVKLVFDEFTELHGDRAFRDDPSIVGGLARLDGLPVMVIGHQKGRGTQDNIRRNFGMPHPEGYRKALRLMQYADRMGLPLLTFIDTPGAFPGIEAEERNQSEAIARNLVVMSRLKVPIVSLIIGEGGSGGALGIGVADRLLMLDNSIYSVISPEGCATILFKDAAHAARAAEVSRLTAQDTLHLGIADEIIPEPEEGAHTAPPQTAQSIKTALKRHLNELMAHDAPELLRRRYARLRRYGAFREGEAETSQRQHTSRLGDTRA